MIQKKTPAARIADLDILPEVLTDPDQVPLETSPTSKDSRMDAEADTMGLKAVKDSHHPQVIDLDVENFTTRLDHLVTSFRNESIKEFLTVKRSILHEQISTIDSERKRCSALISAKQDEIEHLKESLEQANKTNFKNENQKEALGLMVGTLKMKKIAGDLLTKAYLAWSSYHHRSQHKKKVTNLIKSRYRRSVLNYTFIPWKQSWKVFNQSKQQKQFKERLENEKSQLSMHYNKEIEMLANRLAHAERKIAIEEEEKVSIQENLKKAFMRGVCAMNFEAMNILNPGTGLENTTFAPGTPKKEIPEMENPKEKVSFEEISGLIPSESKELKWKAAPVFGRPSTATERPLGNEIVQLTGLPSIPNTNSQGEGKIIVVNNAKTEAKITGKVPIKPIIGKKLGK
jgi:nitrate reductase NapAB chaperone NapD